MRFVLSLLASVIFATSSIQISHAAATATKAVEPVSVELAAYRISQGPKGEVVAQPVDKVKPNDVIEYRANYTNHTNKPIKNLTATLPIPADTQFLAKSAPVAALASTDGVNFAAMPLKRKVGNQTVNVPLQEYRALR